MFLLTWTQVDKQRISQAGRALARKAYDDCLAYLDLRLGELFDELQRRGVLDQTIVIVTADHGEGFGEHDLFDHGQSLYRTEIRVPLVMVLPARNRPQGAIGEPVSLRDVPATIADLVGPGTKSPFPGRSLTRFWRGPSPRRPRYPDLVISCSPSWRLRIRSIPIKVDLPPIEARSTHWPKVIMSTSAMVATAARSCSTSAMIRAS